MQVREPLSTIQGSSPIARSPDGPSGPLTTIVSAAGSSVSTGPWDLQNKFRGGGGRREQTHSPPTPVPPATSPEMNNAGRSQDFCFSPLPRRLARGSRSRIMEIKLWLCGGHVIM